MDFPSFLAFDIGASGGRAILGCLGKKRLEIREIHRFVNKMIYRDGHYYWDIYKLLNHLH